MYTRIYSPSGSVLSSKPCQRGCKFWLHFYIPNSKPCQRGCKFWLHFYVPNSKPCQRGCKFWVHFYIPNSKPCQRGCKFWLHFYIPNSKPCQRGCKFWLQFYIPEPSFSIYFNPTQCMLGLNIFTVCNVKVVDTDQLASQLIRNHCVFHFYF